MNDVIDRLNEQDDVVKTEYTRHDGNEGRITVEMWHDAESLQHIVGRAITGGATLSQKGIQNIAEDKALAVRETRTKLAAPFESIK